MPYLAQAFVRLRPSDEGFKADATAKVKAATAGLTASAKITANTLAATADVAKLRAHLAAFSRLTYEAGLKVKGGSEAELALARVALGLAKLDRTTAQPKVTVEGLAAAEVKLLAFERVFSRLGRAQGIGGGAGGIGGLIGKAGGLVTGGGGAGGGAVPALIGGGAAAGIALLEAGVAGIIPLLASAAIGVAAFGALAIPTIGAVSSAFSGARAAAAKYQLASANLNIAIHQSRADWLAYQKTIHGLEPDFQAAAKLLTNQDVLWQNLSPSMQKAVVALSNNKAALKLLLPDQKRALDALLAQKKAWDQLPAGQKPAISAMQQIGVVWSKMVAAFAPTVFKILSAGLKGVLALLPALLPFANAAAGAILKLANGFAKFAASPGFKAFLAQMLKLTGPAILAIGQGLGQVAVAVGKLLLAFINPNGIRALRLFFTIIAGFITGTAALFTWATPRVIKNIHQLAAAFDRVRHDVAAVLGWFRTNFDIFRNHTAIVFDRIRHDVVHIWDVTWQNTIGRIRRGIHDAAIDFDSFRHRTAVIFDGVRHDLAHIWDQVWNNTVGRVQRGAADVVAWFKGLPGRILGALGDLGSLLINAGAAIIGGLWQGMKNAWNAVTGWLGSLGGIISHLKGPLDKDRVLLRPHGMAIMGGLRAGLAAGWPGVEAHLAGVTAAIAGMYPAPVIPGLRAGVALGGLHAGAGAAPAGAGGLTAVDTGLEGHLAAIAGAVDALSAAIVAGSRAGAAAAHAGAYQSYYGVR